MCHAYCFCVSRCVSASVCVRLECSNFVHVAVVAHGYTATMPFLVASLFSFPPTSPLCCRSVQMCRETAYGLDTARLSRNSPKSSTAFTTRKALRKSNSDQSGRSSSRKFEKGNSCWSCRKIPSVASLVCDIRLFPSIACLFCRVLSHRSSLTISFHGALPGEECKITLTKDSTTGPFARMERALKVAEAAGDLSARPDLFQAAAGDAVPKDVLESMKKPDASPSSWRGASTYQLPSAPKVCLHGN